MAPSPGNTTTADATRDATQQRKTGRGWFEWSDAVVALTVAAAVVTVVSLSSKDEKTSDPPAIPSGSPESAAPAMPVPTAAPAKDPSPSLPPADLPPFAPPSRPPSTRLPTVSRAPVPTFVQEPSSPAPVPPTPTETLSFEEWFGTLDDLLRQNDPNPDAVAWLRNTTTTTPLAAHRFTQRYALAALYYSTDGARWTTSTSWLVADNECEWFTSEGDMCGDGDRISTLSLKQNNLVGTIPRDLGLLTDLRSLEISESSGLLSVDMPGL
jgi:hypothetical protein